MNNKYLMLIIVCIISAPPKSNNSSSGSDLDALTESAAQANVSHTEMVASASSREQSDLDAKNASQSSSTSTDDSVVAITQIVETQQSLHTAIIKILSSLSPEQLNQFYHIFLSISAAPEPTTGIAIHTFHPIASIIEASTFSHPASQAQAATDGTIRQAFLPISSASATLADHNITSDYQVTRIKSSIHTLNPIKLKKLKIEIEKIKRNDVDSDETGGKDD